jgi:serine/threonine protein kinase
VERWRQIESVFQEALQRDPAERDAYVRKACHGDSGLQREVASLLTNHHEASDFKPWAAAAAAQLIAGPDSLQAGQHLGPYEILAPIGKGGMGEVYKSRDTRLKREVAIKICSAQFSERFEREARVIASLNHPNICQIYDVGPNYLVMELIEGETLSGPLPVETALNYARQIAEALDAAHAKGIVHRDLKPGNVKITPAGVVKVLDFGLAKAAEEPSAPDPTNAPTLTMSPTRAGVIMGTAAYMSPEQARGLVVDKRADIWAFGCVLYEMLTGKQAFHGETTSDILAAVLRAEPDWKPIPKRAQPLLRRCLEKDPKRRLRDIGDAMPLLDSAPVVAPAPWPWPWIALATVLMVALAILALLHLRETPPEMRVITASINPPENTNFGPIGFNTPALSPDGRQIAFRAHGDDGKFLLWVRPLDSPVARLLHGAEGSTGNPFQFWSPDSRSIAFFANGKLKRTAVEGGPVLTLADAPTGGGGSWSPLDIIVFAPQFRGPLERVSANGGSPIAATTLEAAHDYAHRFPWFLPDGHHFLFAAETQQGNREFMLRIGSLDSREVKTIGPANSNALYSSGYLLYVRRNTLMAQPFDENTLATTGDAAPLAEQVPDILPNVPSTGTVGAFSVAREGLLAYRTEAVGSEQLTWFDRSGKPVGTLGDPGEFSSVDFSPDGKKVAVTLRSQNIWIYDVSRAVGAPVTFSPSVNSTPVWSPDSRSIIYQATVGNRFNLYRKAADGTGNDELVYSDAVNKILTSWSPDGKLLLYFANPATQGSRIWALLLGPKGAFGPPSELFPWLARPFSRGMPKFSPDGYWAAYVSNDSGRNEIYVAPFPGPGPKRQISTGGASFPRWRADGKEIFYAHNGTLMAAEVSAKGAEFGVGAIRSLGIRVTFPHYRYDVSTDGQRFLVATPREQKSSEPLTLVYNWTALLKKK